MFKKLFANVLSFIGIFMVTFVMVFEAKAEYCNMVGGSKEIHWIYIPKFMQYPLNKTYSLNRKTYDYDDGNRLFAHYRKIPDVNKIVELNVNILPSSIPECLPIQQCSKETLDNWDRIKNINRYGDSIFINSKGVASINKDIYVGDRKGGNVNWTLNKGAKLKILGYQYIDGVLFALVYVISC